jgi:hypothetical protein
MNTYKVINAPQLNVLLLHRFFTYHVCYTVANPPTYQPTYLTRYLRYLWLTEQKKELLRACKQDKKRQDQRRAIELSRAVEGRLGLGSPSGGGARHLNSLGGDISGFDSVEAACRDLEAELEEKAAVRDRVARWRAEKEELEKRKQVSMAERPCIVGNS